jgi:mono/diheme cytochrome c family protein
VGADLTDDPWLWGDGSLDGITKTITQGVAKPKQVGGAMPPNGGTTLKPDELKAVAAYVYAISRKKTH